MKVEQFIKKQVERILAEAKPDTSTKFTKKVGRGRVSNAAKQALNYAATQPANLLSDLNVSNFSPIASATNFHNAKRFLSEIVIKCPEMFLAFDDCSEVGNEIVVPVKVIEGKKSAITPTQAPKYIKACMIAGTLENKIFYDDSKHQISIRKTDSNLEEKFAVVIRYSE